MEAETVEDVLRDMRAIDIKLIPASLKVLANRLEAAILADRKTRHAPEKAEAVVLLRELVTALDGAFISTWQSTADWSKQLGAARDYLAALNEKEIG